MSAVGFARWQYFQKNKHWSPSVIEEQIGHSPVDGGFDMTVLLRALQRQTKEHPYAREFRNSWHIDTNGPDWRDDYYIVHIYNRDEAILYNPNRYKPKQNGWKLNDVLIPLLLKKADDSYTESKDLDEAESRMMKWWKAQRK